MNKIVFGHRVYLQPVRPPATQIGIYFVSDQKQHDITNDNQPKCNSIGERVGKATAAEAVIQISDDSRRTSLLRIRPATHHTQSIVAHGLQEMSVTSDRMPLYTVYCR